MRRLWIALVIAALVGTAIWYLVPPEWHSFPVTVVFPVGCWFAVRNANATKQSATELRITFWLLLLSAVIFAATGITSYRGGYFPDAIAYSTTGVLLIGVAVYSRTQVKRIS